MFDTIIASIGLIILGVIIGIPFGLWLLKRWAKKQSQDYFSQIITTAGQIANNILPPKKVDEELNIEEEEYNGEREFDGTTGSGQTAEDNNADGTDD